MKKNYLILFSILTVFILFSCRSTPAQQEEIPEEVVELSTEVLDESITGAEAARQRAADFESPAYFPSDWEAIEAQLDAARNMPYSTQDEIQQAIDAFNAAAAAYDELFAKTIPLYAQAREDEILAAREALINTGFTSYFPEFLLRADMLALAALDQYEDGDYYAARETAAAALDEYETLLLGARVFLTHEEIITRGFEIYDPENFEKANNVAAAAVSEYEAGNIEEAVAYAEEALLRFNMVLANGWISFVADRREYAVSEREQALEERANIASRELFRSADTVFNQAEGYLAAESFHDAATHYIEAEARFVIARMDTRERRERAEAAIRMAEERIDESSETAQEADRIIAETHIEGGSR